VSSTSSNTIPSATCSRYRGPSRSSEPTSSRPSAATTSLDEDAIAAIEAAIEEQRKPSASATLALHQAEQWRDQLIADDDALTRWLSSVPDADVQNLRALSRQARKDAQANAAQERAGEAVRQGKAYREIFQIVRTALNKDSDEAATDPDAEQP
jgi:ribosome-associated protein